MYEITELFARAYVMSKINEKIERLLNEFHEFLEIFKNRLIGKTNKERMENTIKA